MMRYFEVDKDLNVISPEWVANWERETGKRAIAPCWPLLPDYTRNPPPGEPRYTYRNPMWKPEYEDSSVKCSMSLHLGNPVEGKEGVYHILIDGQQQRRMAEKVERDLGISVPEPEGGW
jgi:hypothetical protein